MKFQGLVIASAVASTVAAAPSKHDYVREWDNRVPLRAPFARRGGWNSSTSASDDAAYPITSGKTHIDVTTEVEVVTKPCEECPGETVTKTTNSSLIVTTPSGSQRLAKNVFLRL